MLISFNYLIKLSRCIPINTMAVTFELSSLTLQRRSHELYQNNNILMEYKFRMILLHMKDQGYGQCTYNYIITDIIFVC